MAEHGFTPGKWWIAGKGTIRAGDMDWVANVANHNRDANARLIAASPTLLEALIQAVEEIEDLRKYANNHGAMIDNERCDYARAAITLATGKDA